MHNFIVCGWYTPDYRHYWTKLQQQLVEIGAPHDFCECPKGAGGWEANTRRKPAQILAALDRNPDKVVIFIDVDCAIPGGLAGLTELASIPSDVAFYLRSGRRRTGTPRFNPRTGTMVFQPTQRARAFVEQWYAASSAAPRYSNDQEILPIVLGKVPGLSVTFVDVRFCALPCDKCPVPVILHDRPRQSRPFKRLVKLFGRWAWAMSQLGRQAAR